MRALHVAGGGGDQNIVRVPHGGVAVIVQEVPHEHRVLGALQEVDASDHLIFVAGARNAVGKGSGWVVHHRQILGEGDRRRIEPGDGNLVPREGCSGLGIDELLGLVQRAEVAGQRRRGGQHDLRLRDALHLPRPLVAAEEEELVFNDAAADGAAELVAMEHVVSGQEIVARVDAAVAQELKQVAVQLVGAGLGHDIHGAARMQAIAGRQGVGLDAEFLQRVGEGERQVDIRERVVVVSAVEQVVDVVALRTGHRDDHRAVEALAADVVVAGSGSVDRAARQEHQRGGLPPVQRQFQNAALIDHLRDGVVLGLDHGGLRLHLDVFGDRTDLQAGIDLHVVPDLQKNVRLRISLEALGGDFEPVRTERQVGENVAAVGIGRGGACVLGIGLNRFDRGARYGGAGGIQNLTLNFGHRDGLAESRGGDQQGRHRCAGERNYKETRALCHNLLLKKRLQSGYNLSPQDAGLT